MKTKLIFDSEKEDDVHELNIILQAKGMHSVLWDFCNTLRNQIKYNENELASREPRQVLIEMKELLHDLCTNNNVTVLD